MNDLGAGREQPGVVPLRPLTAAEIMQGSLATIRNHPGLLLGVAFVVVAVTEVLRIAFTWNLDLDVPAVDPDQGALTAQQLRDLLVSLATQLGIALAVGLVADAFLSGLGIAVVGRAVLGRSFSPGQAWRELRPRLLPLLGLTVVYSVLVALGPAAAMLLVVGFGGTGVALFLLVGAGVALWLYVRYSLAMPALVLEPARIGGALQRSAALVRGAWARTFGILLAAWAVALLLSMMIEMLVGTVTGTGSGTTGATVMFAVGATVAGTLTRPFTAVVTALVYIDRRMRVENMQQALRDAAAGNQGAE